MTTRAARAMRLHVNSFEVWIAVAAVLSAVGFLFKLPDQAPIHELLGTWGYLWVAGLGVAGVGILCGIWWGRANLEVAGLIALCAAALIQGIALVLSRVWVSLPSELLFLALGWACVQRVHLIVGPRGNR